MTDAKEFYDNLAREVAEQAEHYKNMTPAEKRVTLARDVLRLLNERVFVARRGSYGLAALEATHGRLQDIRERVFEEKPTVCGCAKAAMVFCSVLRTGWLQAIRFDASMEKPVEWNRLSEQLYNMEVAFEGWKYFIYKGKMKATELVSDAWSQYATYMLTDEQRLRLIMQHLIDHEGVFDFTLFVNSAPVVAALRESEQNDNQPRGTA